MTSSEIRSRFLAFFEKRGHTILPSASLVPENDPSVLFNTAGMQPLVPYLMGQKHPLGSRLASCQKCVRTGDLEDIGDNRHFSFFEMLGNWSLGDYFKQEAISWSYEFLTNKEEGLGLDPARLAVTIFEGDTNAPFDQESKDIWMSLGIPEHRIFALPADDNWWSPGDNGPCGPCSEMFYDMNNAFVGQEISKDSFIEQVKKETFIEIWNDVFMEYEKKDSVVIGKLSQKNVDTGAGLERITAVMQQKNTAYDTDLFETALVVLDSIIPTQNDVYDNWGGKNSSFDKRNKRVVLDHLRTALFIISDGITPSSRDQGYILRRLIRRTVRFAKSYSINLRDLLKIFESFISLYKNIYKGVANDIVNKIFSEEVEKFSKTLDEGLRHVDKILKQKEISKEVVFGHEVFDWYQKYGFPKEMSEEIAKERNHPFSNSYEDEYKKAELQHQEKSRSGSEQKFKGGLANTNEATVKLHTAHHLLLAALQEIVDKNIHQRGSNITEERLRMDFSFDRKVTPEELQQVEVLVNSWIEAKLPVVRREMPREEAEKLGAEMEFGAKYPDVVSVYTIQNTNDEYVSKEFCGGPHVTNTSEIGKFKIQKEEASSAGVRRIKAVIE